MAFYVKTLAHSISPTGDELVTQEWCYPRKIHSEGLTHRVLSRNSASSRAIPVEKMLSRIEEDPVIPIWWGANQAGMQAFAEVEDKEAAKHWWLEGAAFAVAHARRGQALGLHKQIVNRVTEPYMWITVIYSFTTCSNLYGLRVHKDAEPHFQKIARMSKEAYEESRPRAVELKEGQWHLPLIYDEDRVLARKLVEDTNAENHVIDGDAYPSAEEIERQMDMVLVKVSVGRCARVSYLTHDGRRDLMEDIKLHDRLSVQEPLHASPAEHVAQALSWPRWFKKGWPSLAAHTSRELNIKRMEARERYEKGSDFGVGEMAVEAALAQIQSGNFRGFRQYRKTLKNEHIGEPMP